MMGSLIGALVQKNSYIEPLHNLGIYLSLQCLLLILSFFLDGEAEPENEIIGFLD